MTVYLVVLAGAMVAGFVQGLSGFGFSMVAMSFWAWVLDPRLAAILAVFGGMTGQIVGAVAVRRKVAWRSLLPFLLGGFAGIPLGIAVLPHLDMDTFKAVLGSLLIAWCPAMLMARRLPAIRAGGRGADAVVGVAGGVLGGIGGFSGTLPTLWCTLRGFDKDTQRSVIQNFNLAMLSTTMLGYVASGLVTRDMLSWFALVAPAMLVPSLLGARLYLGISEARFRQVVLGLLTASGAVLLAASLPRLVARLG